MFVRVYFFDQMQPHSYLKTGLVRKGMANRHVRQIGNCACDCEWLFVFQCGPAMSMATCPGGARFSRYGSLLRRQQTLLTLSAGESGWKSQDLACGVRVLQICGKVGSPTTTRDRSSRYKLAKSPERARGRRCRGRIWSTAEEGQELGCHTAVKTGGGGWEMSPAMPPPEFMLAHGVTRKQKREVFVWNL